MLEKRVGVALVAPQYSVVVKGMEKKLFDIGYKVVSIENNIDDIKGCSADVELYILYIPDNIIENEMKLKNLEFMIRLIDKEGKKSVAIGEKVSRNDLVDTVPELGNFMWLDKPVEMDNLDYTLNKAFSGELDMGRRKRILLVDDDPAYAKMVREWIKEEYRVDIVTAGMKALGFLVKVKKEDMVDLILLDYEMPVVDGPKVLQMLRQDPVTANIPTVFLTGNSTKEAVSRVMELKPDGYILKTTTKSELLNYLNNEFKKRKQAEE